MIIKGAVSYAGVLDIPESTSGAFAIKHRIRPAGTTLRSGNLRTTVYGQRSEDLVFHEATRWHALTEDEGVWMTDDPIEQRQHDEQLRTMKGHVLVGGLGLGYAVVALAHNRGIKSITVVEKSPEVVNLTWAATLARVKTIRPTLPVTLVVNDLFTYLEAWTPVMADATAGLPFDTAFYDIWQSDGETTFHTVVMPLRELSRGKVRRVVCWNEDIMRGQLLMGLISRLQFALSADRLGHIGAIMTVEQLAEPHDNIYVDWAVPFWQMVRDEKMSVTTAQSVARTYTKRYGITQLTR